MRAASASRGIFDIMVVQLFILNRCALEGPLHYPPPLEPASFGESVTVLNRHLARGEAAWEFLEILAGIIASRCLSLGIPS